MSLFSEFSFWEQELAAASHCCFQRITNSLTCNALFTGVEADSPQMEPQSTAIDKLVSTDPGADTVKAHLFDNPVRFCVKSCHEW